MDKELPFETVKFNPIEMACCFTNSKNLQFFIEDLKLISYRDFNVNKEGGLAGNHKILLGPIVNQDSKALSLLLDLSHLWAYSDF